VQNKYQEIHSNELEELLNSAREYDPRAIARICEHFLPKIYQYVFYRVNGREDAEDLMNEICLRVINSIRNQQGSFTAWIFRIASNMVTDYYRRRAVRRNVELRENTIEAVEDKSNMPDKLLIQEEVKQALLHLTEEQQQVIILKFIEGYENDEIAVMLGKSVGAIRALQFRALTSLRNLLR